MANPYEVDVVNPLQALLAGQQGYSTANKQLLESQKQQARSQAFQDYQSGNAQSAIGRLLQIGDTEGVSAIGTIEQRKQQNDFNQRDFAFRQQEAQRAQKNADRSFGLQSQQFAENQDYSPQERAKLAAENGIQPGTPEFKAYVLTGKLPEGSTTLTQQADQRKAAAASLGLTQDNPAYNSYVLTGKMPREDAQPLAATDKKLISTAEDELPNIEGTIESLKVARDLNTKTFTGFGAGAKGYIGTAVPGGNLLVDRDKAMATSEFGKVMSGEAIKTMANTLKGATTDFELKKFETMLADPATPPEIRGRVIDRMIKLAERQKEVQVRRIQDLRGQTYFKPQGGQGAAPPQAANPQGGAITQEQYAALPSGSIFTAPDGTQRVKP